MNVNLINAGILSLAFLCLFAIAEWLYHKRKVEAELTRKLVHTVTGLLTLLFPPLLTSHWYVLLLCGSFLILLVASMKLNMLKSVNAVERITNGSLMYPVIVYGGFLVYHHFDQYVFYYLPILVLAICDPVASLVGRRFPIGKYRVFGQSKTLAGSFGFFASALVIGVFLLIGVEDYGVLFALAVATSVGVGAALVEAVTYKGYDNLTIPLAVHLILILYNLG